jgi:hypothetical protein
VSQHFDPVTQEPLKDLAESDKVQVDFGGGKYETFSKDYLIGMSFHFCLRGTCGFPVIRDISLTCTFLDIGWIQCKALKGRILPELPSRPSLGIRGLSNSSCRRMYGCLPCSVVRAIRSFRRYETANRKYKHNDPWRSTICSRNQILPEVPWLSYEIFIISVANLVLFTKWQELLLSLNTTADIIDLIWVDSIVNVVTGVKGWIAVCFAP